MPRGGYNRTVYNPTPDAIRAETAAIRAGWTEDDRQRRLVQKPETDPAVPRARILVRCMRPAVVGSMQRDENGDPWWWRR